MAVLVIVQMVVKGVVMERKWWKMAEMVEEAVEVVLHAVKCISSCDHLEINTLWDPLTLLKKGAYLRFCSETILSFFVSHLFPCVQPFDYGILLWPSLKPPGRGYHNLALDLSPPKAKGSGSWGFKSWLCLLHGV